MCVCEAMHVLYMYMCTVSWVLMYPPSLPSLPFLHHSLIPFLPPSLPPSLPLSLSPSLCLSLPPSPVVGSTKYGLPTYGNTCYMNEVGWGSEAGRERWCEGWGSEGVREWGGEGWGGREWGGEGWGSDRGSEEVRLWREWGCEGVTWRAVNARQHYHLPGGHSSGISMEAHNVTFRLAIKACRVLSTV